MRSLSASSAFINGNIAGPTRVSWSDQGVITSVESIEIESAEYVGLLCPGFIDLQVNGIGEIDVAHATGSQWDELSRLLLRQGVTSWCPTLISADLKRMSISIDEIGVQIKRQGMNPQAVSAIVGCHLEGPFLGAAIGAHNSQQVIAVDLSWIAGLPSHVRIMTIGAEQPLVERAIEILCAAGTVVSLGHTRASDAQIAQAKKAGATMFTHLFNAMSGIHHRTEGVALFALTDEQMFASLIVDLEHVSARAVQLAFRAKQNSIILVTDSVRTGHNSSDNSGHNSGPAPRLADGTLAGSVLSMNVALRNSVVSCGISIAQAIASATSTPARALGLTDRGQVAVGLRADLTILTDEFAVAQTVSGGQIVSFN